MIFRVFLFLVVRCSNEVWHALKMQDVDQRGGLTLSGHPVCQRAWRLLLGVGKSRFTRLRNAIVQGRADPPGDGRYGVKRHTTLIPSDGARAAVHEYLTKLYHSTAEPLPEGRQAEDVVEITNRARRVKRRGKRPRHFVKREERSSGFAPTIKFLPPGTIGLYWDMCKADNPDLRISRKVFTRAAGTSKLFSLCELSHLNASSNCPLSQGLGGELQRPLGDPAKKPAQGVLALHSLQASASTFAVPTRSQS